MTVIPTELGDDAGSVGHEHIPSIAPSGAPAEMSRQVLITEQQVMLGSAITISVPEADRRRANPFRALATALGRIVTWSPDEQDQHLKHARRTPDWYSDALMAREMRRL